MTASSAGSPFRFVRTFARPAIALVIALGAGLGPWAAAAASAASTAGGAVNGSGSDAASSAGVSSLQVQAQELAGQIAADGRTLDQLDASYEAAQISYQRLTGQAVAMQSTLAATAAEVSATRSALKQQALLAYLAGGAPVVTQISNQPGVDRSLTVAYAEIVAGGQKTALAGYRAALDTQTRQQATLDADTRQMGTTLASIKATVSQATTTMASQQRALSQVKGQLAAAVAAVQAQQQAAEQTQEESALSAQGVQLPASVASVQSHYSTAGPSTAPATTRAVPPSSAPPATPAPTTGHSVQPPTAVATTTPTTAPTTTGSDTSGSPPAQAPGVSGVLAYAEAQIGKPYQWGGAGPNSFDCSGLVMMAWAQAGVSFPHLAQDQYNLTAREPLVDLQPGDLVFFGTPNNVYHVGIYVGGGNMIDAPETGETIHVQSIYWDALLGAGRVTANS